MKKYLSIFFILIVASVMFGCSNNKKTYAMSDYILNLDYKEDFKILQLTDTHIGIKDNQQYQYDFIDLTIKDSNADFIVITGDFFTFADKALEKRYFEFNE